jgi:RPA family protein
VLNAVVGKLRTYERGDRTNVAIEPESITEVDEATRDVWVAETASQTRARLEAFETGDTPFSEEATEAYGEDVSEIEAAVSPVVPDDAA